VEAGALLSEGVPHDTTSTFALWVMALFLW
jgi:hypothetical protein